VGDEFRANVHRGGKAEGVRLNAEYERTALRAAQILGLRVAGVDMLESEDGPQVLEVNASPGLQGIEQATRIDVAGSIVEHLEQQVSFPDFDLRQRLTLKSGYNVVEFAVFPNSELAGKTLRQAALRDRDVQVLSITRGTAVIPNPRGDQVLMTGDLLLCFGKDLTLKNLMPSNGVSHMNSPSTPPSGD
jgi:ribosomal protein S6--L-glutamate ligase